MLAALRLFIGIYRAYLIPLILRNLGGTFVVPIKTENFTDIYRLRRSALGSPYVPGGGRLVGNVYGVR